MNSDKSFYGFFEENNSSYFGNNEEEYSSCIFDQPFLNENKIDNKYEYSNLFQKVNETNINIENFSTNNSIQNTESMEIIKLIKRGRKKIGDESIRKNNKFRIDNEIYKFKTKFYQIFLIEICNKLIEKFFPNETSRFKKIDKNIIKNLNIKKNIKLLNSPLKDFLSFNISDKYNKKYEKEYNKNLLKKYENKNDYFKTLFESKIDSLYKIFINDNCVNIIKNIFTIECKFSLNYFLNEIDDKKYKESLETNWKNIYSFFNLKKKIKNQNEDFY